MKKPGIRSQTKLLYLSACIVLACAVALPLFAAPFFNTGQRRDIVISARQYAYAPHRIVVNRGDKVHLKLAAVDVVHGFFLEGYDIEAHAFPGRLPFKLRHPSKERNYRQVEEVIFTANRSGKYRYRCSINCGTLHPFMLGELIVRPNHAYLAGIGSAVGLSIAAFLWMFVTARRADTFEDVSVAAAGAQLFESPPGSMLLVGAKPRLAPALDVEGPPRHVDLLETVPGLKYLVKHPWLQFSLVVPNLGFLLLFLIAGFFGSPVGNRNIIITFVWILWWFLLITLLLPFGSRVWCLVCPFPFFGEWFQRRRLLGPPARAKGVRRLQLKGLNRKWPPALSNIWLQNVLFLGMCTFSSILVTRPIATAAALAGLAVLATVFHLIFQRRTFCLYICPVSGFLGLYAMASMVEIRAKDQQTCQQCRAKAGILGNDIAWPCPWQRRPNKLQRNNYCGFCMECIRACPHDNMTLRTRPFCADDRIEKADEAWKAFIMITLAMVYSVVLLGPWGTLKSWANVSEVGDWGGFLIYVAIIWGTALVLMPMTWGAAAWMGQRLAGNVGITVKQLFLRYSFLLVPLGLMAWIAFSFPLIMINGSYILTTLSDPMGWGWDLFGTAGLSWHPVLPEYLVYLQMALLLFGLGYTLRHGYRLAVGMFPTQRQGVRSLVPVGLVCTGITLAFIRLFAG